MEYDTFVRRHELQLVHEPEPVSEQESDGQQQGVGNHGWPTLAKHSDSVLANPVLPKERAGVRSNRGSPDACRLCEGARLPGGRPRLLWLPASAKDSFERLVFAEVGNREAQRIDGDQFVGHVVLEDEDEISGIEIALELAVIGG